MAIYTLNEEGVAQVIKPDLTQADIEVAIQARQIAEGAPVSSCIKETLAVVTGKKVIKPNEESNE